MKALILCNICASQSDFVNDLQSYSLAELNNDLVLEGVCPKGHRISTILEGPKYTILFDLGVTALIDGYTREATTSFASSLERFYEFCIKLICHKRKVSHESMMYTWRNISSHSERQIGAFLFLYLIETSMPAKLMPQSQVAFRNNVVHKGHIPTKEEANKYGENVYNLIVSLATKLSEGLVNEPLFVYLKEREERFAGKTLSVTGNWHILDDVFAESKTHRKKFSERLIEYEKEKLRWLHP